MVQHARGFRESKLSLTTSLEGAVERGPFGGAGLSSGSTDALPVAAAGAGAVGVPAAPRMERPAD